MLGEVFYWIFNMSIAAGVMSLPVWLLRKIRRIPRRVTVFLWIIPFFRMCVPLGLNSPCSLMALISRITTKTVTVYQPTDDIAFSATNYVMAADSYFPITYKVSALGRIFAAAGLIWIIVALAVIIALAILYGTTKRELKDLRPYYQNVFLSEKVQNPAVYGILRPRIVLPLSYARRETKYVLRHERSHIRRGDNLWRLLGFLAAALHWFNPLSWLMLRAFLADMELACDETSVSGYSPEERKEYARSLLDCAESKSLFASAFGGAGIRTRIENVLSYKRMTRLSSLCLAALILAIIWGAVTNAP